MDFKGPIAPHSALVSMDFKGPIAPHSALVDMDFKSPIAPHSALVSEKFRLLRCRLKRTAPTDARRRCLQKKFNRQTMDRRTSNPSSVHSIFLRTASAGDSWWSQQERRTRRVQSPRLLVERLALTGPFMVGRRCDKRRAAGGRGGPSPRQKPHAKKSAPRQRTT